mmetsp:Transcript_10245/g.16564  ORF Transcript_10245/g.16564 Transcript_10245/m.16564 type:complete len:94 (+) Transcript_10245:1077-1358(+)
MPGPGPGPGPAWKKGARGGGGVSMRISAGLSRELNYHVQADFVIQHTKTLMVSSALLLTDNRLPATFFAAAFSKQDTVVVGDIIYSCWWSWDG